jgi:2-isopropylmalate synthase
MSTIRMSDITLKQKAAEILTFKEKIELVKLLDRLGVDVVELKGIEHAKADSLSIKTMGDTLKEGILCVEVKPEKAQIDLTVEALRSAGKPRLQIAAPTSLVQMEYLWHMKPEKLRETVVDAIAYAASRIADVEFVALDATRSERDFLYAMAGAAIEAGAKTITLCDNAGNMLPAEFSAFVEEAKRSIPGLDRAALGISCCDDIAMADACSIVSLIAGAAEVKASIYPEGQASLRNLAVLLRKKGSEYGLSSNMRTVELTRVCDQAARLFTTTRSQNSPFENGVRETDDESYFTVHDDIDTIVRETRNLGYDLGEEDQALVYEAFTRLASKKELVYAREIDAIVASAALQVPPTYQLGDFIINSGNVFSATAHIRLKRGGEMLESVALGDGPVDAAFLAIEQITGRHYELDDFQIQSVTEGREAMGETVVKLLSGGKIYSGRGLSTDIIGSSISAYINALNKIVYEEES